MPLSIQLASTTELAAVNRLLSAIGEAPISDLANSTREDVILAVTLLQEASLEVQSLGWKFNQEFGYELAPTAEYTWGMTDGNSDILNIFKKPSNLISFRTSSTPKQGLLDVAIMPSRKYQETSKPVLVFYDREKNRDGFLKADFPYLYIDPVWQLAWDHLPETAKRYITLRAARQFIQQTLGSVDVVGFGSQDEQRALFALQLDQGEEEDISMLDSTDVARVRGLRPSVGTGFFDNRAFPGPA